MANMLSRIVGNLFPERSAAKGNRHARDDASDHNRAKRLKTSDSVDDADAASSYVGTVSRTAPVVSVDHFGPSVNGSEIHSSRGTDHSVSSSIWITDNALDDISSRVKVLVDSIQQMRGQVENDEDPVTGRANPIAQHVKLGRAHDLVKSLLLPHEVNLSERQDFALSQAVLLRVMTEIHECLPQLYGREFFKLVSQSRTSGQMKTQFIKSSDRLPLRSIHTFLSGFRQAFHDVLCYIDIPLDVLDLVSIDLDELLQDRVMPSLCRPQARPDALHQKLGKPGANAEGPLSSIPGSFPAATVSQTAEPQPDVHPQDSTAPGTPRPERGPLAAVTLSSPSSLWLWHQSPFGGERPLSNRSFKYSIISFLKLLPLQKGVLGPKTRPKHLQPSRAMKPLVNKLGNRPKITAHNSHPERSKHGDESPPSSAPAPGEADGDLFKCFKYSVQGGEDRQSTCELMMTPDESPNPSARQALRLSKAADERLALRMERLRLEEQEKKREAEERKKREQEEKRRREEQRLQEEEQRRVKATGLRRPKRPLLPPLDEAWRGKVSTALHGDPASQATKELVPCETPEGELNQRDLGKVVPETEWLNDEVVNGSLQWLDEYVNKRAGATNYPKSKDRVCLVMGSFFYKNLKEKGVTGTERTLRRKGVDKTSFLKMHTILLPICESNHWTLLVIRPIRRTIAHMDSMSPRGSGLVSGIGKDWTRTVLDDLFVEDEWQVVSYAAPGQTNGHDCGMHTILNGMCLALGLNPMDSYSSPQIPEKRISIAAMLLNKGFKGDFDLEGC